MARSGKPKGFRYLDHRTVDARHGIITDSCATPGNVNCSTPYLARLDRQKKRFKLKVEAVGLDAGYNSARIAKGLEDRGGPRGLGLPGTAIAKARNAAQEGIRLRG